MTRQARLCLFADDVGAEVIAVENVVLALNLCLQQLGEKVLLAGTGIRILTRHLGNRAIHQAEHILAAFQLLLFRHVFAFAQNRRNDFDPLRQIFALQSIAIVSDRFPEASLKQFADFLDPIPGPKIIEEIQKQSAVVLGEDLFRLFRKAVHSHGSSSLRLPEQFGTHETLIFQRGKGTVHRHQCNLQLLAQLIRSHAGFTSFEQKENRMIGCMVRLHIYIMSGSVAFVQYYCYFID